MITRVIVILAILSLVACRRETTVVTETGQPTSTSTTLTGPPQDMSNAQVNTAITLERGSYVENSRIGSTLGPEGLVAEESNEFAPSDAIYLSMWFRESPEGLQSRVILEDENGKEIGAAQTPMNGKKTVTFPLAEKRLRPGKYKATGYWGGNVAAEHEFTVATPSKAPAKSKAKAAS